MDLETLLEEYACGDPWPWADEFAYLTEHHSERIAELTKLIRAQGIREPILLGDDGRIWDGHHRLLVARNLGIEHIPVTR